MGDKRIQINREREQNIEKAGQNREQNLDKEGE